MNVADVLRAHGFATTATKPPRTFVAPQTLVASHATTATTATTEKYRGASEPAKSTPAPVADTECVRTALLALADRLAVDRDHVPQLDDAGLALLEAIGEAGMRSFLLAADDAATRRAGKVPLDDTAPALCERCGPVFVHPDIAAVLPVVNGWPRALGCPWCFIRKAGGYIPRPHVACATCTSFQPDSRNPGAGMGTCACGMYHAQQRHACASYRPTTTKEADHD